MSRSEARGASNIPRPRFAELDGLRGWASLFVVLHHSLCAFAPSLVPDLGGENRALSDSPLELFVNGPFWVYVFFVLSGFVLSASVDKRAPALWISVGLRWPRLAIPAASSVMLSWFWLTTLGPPRLMPTEVMSTNPWMQYFLHDVIPNAGVALRHGLFGIFVKRESLFNNVLWTMRIELLGSFAVFIFFASRHAMRRWDVMATVVPAVLLASALWIASKMGVTPMPAFNCFAYGIAIYLTRHVALSKWITVAALMIGLASACFSVGFSDHHGLTWLRQSLRPESEIAHSLAASLIVAALIRIRSRFLTGRVSSWLGINSFALYLVHVPIIYSVAIPSMLWLDAHGHAAAAPFIAGAIGLTVSLLVARVFTSQVDERVVHVLSRVKKELRKFERKNVDAFETLAPVRRDVV